MAGVDISPWESNRERSVMNERRAVSGGGGDGVGSGGGDSY